MTRDYEMMATAITNSGVAVVLFMYQFLSSLIKRGMVSFMEGVSQRSRRAQRVVGIEADVEENAEKQTLGLW